MKDTKINIYDEQRIEQIKNELAEVERQLRSTRAELDEIGVSKVPENVKSGTFLDILIALVFVITGGIVVLVGSSIEAMTLKILIILAGIIIIGVGARYNVNKISIPDIMIQYNTLEKRVQELKAEIQMFQNNAEIEC